MSAMKAATVMWTVIECDPKGQGADAPVSTYGVFGTEEEALAYLADVRNDNPDTGNGWTTVPIVIFSA